MDLVFGLALIRTKRGWQIPSNQDPEGYQGLRGLLYQYTTIITLIVELMEHLIFYLEW